MNSRQYVETAPNRRPCGETYPTYGCQGAGLLAPPEAIDLPAIAFSWSSRRGISDEHIAPSLPWRRRGAVVDRNRADDCGTDSFLDYL
jgi:hypothetical protein